MNKKGYVYILFSQKNGTLYIGVTSNLVKRVYEHKNKFVEGFSKKYGVDKLGYYEVFDSINVAIQREKQLKKYYRKQNSKRYKRYYLRRGSSLRRRVRYVGS